MKYAAICAAGVCLLAMSTVAGADPMARTNASPVDLSQLMSAQQKAEKPKKESSLKQRVKRAWKDLTGYKFVAACPAIPIFQTRYTCTETGKNREDARAKCQAQHPLCAVGDAS